MSVLFVSVVSTTSRHSSGLRNTGSIIAANSSGLVSDSTGSSVDSAASSGSVFVGPLENRIRF